jgi:hypothetical protein
MNLLYPLSLWVVMTLPSFAANDHFPVKQGTIWQFSYVSSSGGWGTVHSDSGTVKWEIEEIVYGASVQNGVTAYITINKTTSLYKRTYLPGFANPKALKYDSVFSPPRVSLDTIQLIDNERDAGIFILGDTCRLLVHNPVVSASKGKISIRDTTVSCLGKTIAASVIDPSPCRWKYSDTKFFITAPDIGPVRYHVENSPYLKDAFWMTDWNLVWTNVNTTAIATEHTLKSGNYSSPQITTIGKRTLFQGILTRPGIVKVSLYTATGSLLGSFSSAALPHGWQQVEIPSTLAQTKGVVIMRVELPDRTVIRQVARRL